MNYLRKLFSFVVPFAFFSAFTNASCPITTLENSYVSMSSISALPIYNPKNVSYQEYWSSLDCGYMDDNGSGSTVVYAGSHVSGIWKSTNNGEGFNKLTNLNPTDCDKILECNNGIVDVSGIFVNRTDVNVNIKNSSYTYFSPDYGITWYYKDLYSDTSYGSPTFGYEFSSSGIMDSGENSTNSTSGCSRLIPSQFLLYFLLSRYLLGYFKG